MIVCEFRTPKNAGPSVLGQIGPISVAFHQETYAWSLPHIDGAVMIDLWIRNTGYEVLQNVHVGAFIEKPAPFTYAEQIIAYAPSGAEPVRARAIVLRDPAMDGGTHLALIGLSPTGNDALMWSGGYVWGADDMIDAVRSRAAARQPEADPNVLLSPFTEPVTAQPGEINITGENNVHAFVVTPRISSIEPGQEVRVQFALVAVGRNADLNEALVLTLRTYAGDGRHRFLPPPVSMTPRVLWGTYYAVGGGVPGVSVEIDELGDDPVRAEQISYLSGIAPGDVDRSELKPGQTRFVIRGDPADKMLEKQGRVTLKGRLATGEFFELILRPVSGEAHRLEPGPTEDADRFWKNPGKLDDVLDDRIELLRNTPNPFRDVTTIHYEVPRLIEQKNGTTLRTNGALATTVKIYDVRGRLVTTLVEEQVPPGLFTVGWNGVDDFGSPMPSGVYFVKLQIGQKFLTKRATLVR